MRKRTRHARGKEYKTYVFFVSESLACNLKNIYLISLLHTNYESLFDDANEGDGDNGEDVGEDDDDD